MFNDFENTNSESEVSDDEENIEYIYKMLENILYRFKYFLKLTNEEEKIINQNINKLNVNKKKIISIQEEILATELINEKNNLFFKNERIVNESINMLENINIILSKIFKNNYQTFFYFYKKVANDYIFKLNNLLSLLSKEENETISKQYLDCKNDILDFQKYEYYYDLYNDIHENETFRYYRIPKSLYNLKTIDKKNFEIHSYYIKNYLKHNKCDNDYYNVIKNNNLYDVINSIKNCDLYFYIYINCIVDNIFKSMKNPFFNNEFNINILKQSITKVFYPYKKINVKSTEGILYKTGLNTKTEMSDIAIKSIRSSRAIGINDNYLFVLKATMQMYEEYNNIIHEYIIGILLNYLFLETPTFVYTYNGFFCSSFNENFESLCNNISSNALTNIIITEYLGEKTLKNILNKLSINQLITIIKIILLTLIISKEKYKFSHNDLHLGNIMIVELDYLKPVKFSFENEEYIFYTKYIPKIIDFGKSTMYLEKDKIIPFTMSQNTINQNFILIEQYIINNDYLSSYDWFRFVISLITELYNLNMIEHIDNIKSFVLYYYKINCYKNIIGKEINNKSISKFIEDLNSNEYKNNDWKYISSLLENNFDNQCYCKIELKELLELI